MSSNPFIVDNPNFSTAATLSGRIRPSLMRAQFLRRLHMSEWEEYIPMIQREQILGQRLSQSLCSNFINLLARVASKIRLRYKN